MKNLAVAFGVTFLFAAPAFCGATGQVPEPGMAGELAVAAVGLAGLLFVFRKKKK